jgi:light-regulated signal transduction histidine kinase (bacteriophytochrome)
MFCIGHDITELTQNTTELKDTKESLTRTRYSLAQINYIQSHVVRKPIANILGLSVLIETMEVEPELKKMVNMISESAKELDQLIRNMAAME